MSYDGPDEDKVDKLQDAEIVREEEERRLARVEVCQHSQMGFDTNWVCFVRRVILKLRCGDCRGVLCHCG